jgi:hypothetical protein
MTQRRQVISSTVLLAVLALNPIAVAQQATATDPKHGAALWTEPTDIASRNLVYGSGGPDHQPQGTMKFVEEDLKGSSPKFEVRDEAGTKWKVKLGKEAKSETAAAHLLWAVGYYADEDYFVADLKVADLPKLKRGQSFVGPDGDVKDARLERHVKDTKNLGIWKWKTNPFKGTREFNGLRVMMALVNNWDLKDINNTIYGKESGAEQIYAVTDLGATFGKPGLSWTPNGSKNNLNAYRHSRFISKIAPEYVDFTLPKHPPLLYILAFREFFSRVGQRWIGKHIPREDAKWMGSLLARLSPQQIQDAFRSAGYSPEEVEAFAAVVQARIAELNKL